MLWILSAEGLLEQYKTNIYGVANVTCAFLPYMRARRDGIIVVTGSRSGARILPVSSLLSYLKSFQRN